HPPNHYRVLSVILSRTDSAAGATNLTKVSPRARGPRSLTPAAKQENGAGDLLLLTQVLELNILEGHFHALAAVQLPGDDAFVRHLGEVVVHRGLPVQLNRDVLAHALDVVVVEVVFLQDPVDDLFRGLLHHAAEVLPVQAAPVFSAHVTLGPLDGVLLRFEVLTADLDAAVAGPAVPDQPHLKFQLEILVLLLAAQEGVELQAVRHG